jgi:hypothetical protein
MLMSAHVNDIRLQPLFTWPQKNTDVTRINLLHKILCNTDVTRINLLHKIWCNTDVTRINLLHKIWCNIQKNDNMIAALQSLYHYINDILSSNVCVVVHSKTRFAARWR